jgi:hypothetical protein
MAGFAKWTVAAEPALPWEPGEFLIGYTDNISSANSIAIESSPIFTALVGVLRARPDNKFDDTVSELYETMKAQNTDLRLPSGASHLT